MSNNVAMASSQSGMLLLLRVLAKRQHTERQLPDWEQSYNQCKVNTSVLMPFSKSRVPYPQIPVTVCVESVQGMALEVVQQSKGLCEGI